MRRELPNGLRKQRIRKGYHTFYGVLSAARLQGRGPSSPTRFDHVEESVDLGFVRGSRALAPPLLGLFSLGIPVN